MRRPWPDWTSCSRRPARTARGRHPRPTPGNQCLIPSRNIHNDHAVWRGMVGLVGGWGRPLGRASVPCGVRRSVVALLGLFARPTARAGLAAYRRVRCDPARRPAVAGSALRITLHCWSNSGGRFGVMEYTNLGRSGLSVSRLVLGTMNFGPETSEEDSHAIMDRAHELGINFFDTANVYGRKQGEGITEQIIGRWFGTGGGRREKTVIATKLYGSMGSWPNENRLSALNIRRAAEGSLTRLQTDYLDVYQMHHVDRATPWDEIWEAFSVLHQQGKVLYFGSSNFAGWHLAQAQEAALARHLLGLVSEQSLYNLMSRWVELEVLPAARHYGLGVIPWSPLHGGLLGGALRKQREGSGSRSTAGRAADGLAESRDKIEAYEKLAAEHGEDPANLALAWLLHQDGVTGPIIGPRTISQLDGSLRALEIKLDEKGLTSLDELFPAPGPNGAKPAPEAYAW